MTSEEKYARCPSSLIETHAAELAKFKALAETLARALARCGRIVERHNWRQSEKVDDVKRIVAETLLQYKEARDAS